MSSQVIAKQEAYVQLLDQDGTPSYDCAWCVLLGFEL